MLQEPNLQKKNEIQAAQRGTQGARHSEVFIDLLSSAGQTQEDDYYTWTLKNSLPTLASVFFSLSHTHVLT